VPPTVTIRMLLDHTSGIYDYFLHPKIDKALYGDRDRTWTTAQAMRYVGAPYFRPGTEWRYSNTNYLLLGLVAEAVTGHSLEDELRARFLEPLALDHTTFQSREPAAGPVSGSYRFTSGAKTAKPIGLGDNSGIVPFTSVVTASGAAGSIASTSGDLARWARALYGGDVLDPAMFGLMVGDVAATKAFRPSVPYGLGVQRVKIAGHIAYGHSGRFIGARALIRHIPDLGITVAAVSNTNRTDLATLVARLVKVASPAPEPSPSAAPSATESSTPSS
jgi:D-alanyl-D-alanine carboxypeptidase